MPEKIPYSLPAGGRWVAARLLPLLLILASFLSLTQLVGALLEALGTQKHLTWAAHINPLDHHPLLLLADLEPDRAQVYYSRIRLLHPGYAPAWIRLGLDLERQGDLSAARNALSHAASLDRTFLPQWTLANFHFRRGDEPAFWRYARTAASHYQGDLTGVFSLCLRLENNPLAVLNRLEPAQPQARLDLLNLLLAQNRLHDAALVAPVAAESEVRGVAEALLSGCDRAIAARDVTGAIAFWNAAAAHRWIARGSLDPAAGILIADPAFHHQPTGACFDWSLSRQDGVLAHTGLPAGLRLDLSGRQSPGAVVARLRLPVLPGRRYRLVWRYGYEFTQDSAPPVWRIAGQVTEPWPQAGHAREENTVFTAGASSPIDLELALPAVMGRTRPEGRLRLEWVRVEPVAGSQSTSGYL